MAMEPDRVAWGKEPLIPDAIGPKETSTNNEILDYYLNNRVVRLIRIFGAGGAGLSIMFMYYFIPYYYLFGESSLVLLAIYLGVQAFGQTIGGVLDLFLSPSAIVSANAVFAFGAVGDVLAELIYLLYPTVVTNAISFFIHGVGLNRWIHFYVASYHRAAPKFRGGTSSAYLLSLLVGWSLPLPIYAVLLYATDVDNLNVVASWLRWSLLPLAILATILPFLLPSMHPETDNQLLPLPQIYKIFRHEQMAKYWKGLRRSSRVVTRKPWTISLSISCFFFSMVVSALSFMGIEYSSSSNSNSSGETEYNNEGSMLKIVLVTGEISGALFGLIFGTVVCDHIGVRRTNRMWVTTSLGFLFLIPLILLLLATISEPVAQIGLFFIVSTVFYAILVQLPLLVLSVASLNEEETLVTMYTALYQLPVASGTTLFSVIFIIFDQFLEVPSLWFFVSIFSIGILGPIALIVGLLVSMLWKDYAEKGGRSLEEQLAEARKSLDDSVINDNVEALFASYADKRWLIPSADVLVLDRIAAGAFGSIHKGKWKSFNVAVKVIHQLIQETDLALAFAKEVEIVAELRHPNICCFYGVVLEYGQACLVTELCLGNLYDYLHDPRTPVRGNQAQSMAADVARGVAYLHSLSPPVMHRDLKSLNILIADASGTLKLCDFGESVNVTSTADRTMTLVGTAMWTAPEVLSGSSYDLSADIYSLGVVLLEIATCEDPFPANMYPAMVIASVVQGKRPFVPSFVDAGVKRLITSCWEQDPGLRPSASAVLDTLSNTGGWDFVECIQSNLPICMD